MGVISEKMMGDKDLPEYAYFRVGDVGILVPSEHKDKTIKCKIISQREQHTKFAGVTEQHYTVIVDDIPDFGFDSKAYGFSLLDLECLNKNKNLANKDSRFINITSRLKSLRFSEPRTSSHTKDKTMSKIVETLRTDAREAAYRVAGTQITSGVKAALVKLISSKGGGSEQVEMLKMLLDTEMGDSIISLMLGYGLNYAPGLKDDPRVQKLSEEFRVNGMSVAGNAVIGAAMESFLPVLTNALAALPAEGSAFRVKDADDSESEEEEEAPVKAVKSASR